MFCEYYPMCFFLTNVKYRKVIIVENFKGTSPSYYIFDLLKITFSIKYGLGKGIKERQHALVETTNVKKHKVGIRIVLATTSTPPIISPQNN